VFIQNSTHIILTEHSKDFYYPIFPTNSSISSMHIPFTERETHIFFITFHIALAMFRLNMYLIVEELETNLMSLVIFIKLNICSTCFEH